MLKVSDETNNTSGFKDDNDQNSQDLVDDYSYDANGNMTSDQNKNINLITYNHLNLPKTINFGSLGSINYIYNALGQKVKKTVLEDGATNATDYLDGYQYLNKYLKYFPTAEGYVNAWQDTGIMQQGSYLFNYVYSYTDHLGNIRLSYAKDPKTNTLKILEQNHYYPFGLKHENYNSERKIFAKEEAEILQQGQTGAANVMALNGLNVSGRMKIVPGGGGGGAVVYGERNYKYNGKELQNELGLNMYDYGWRNYMPDLGRWSQIDPLFNDLKFANDNNNVDEDDQEAVYISIINDLEIGGGIYNTDNLNPYGYGYNNPISFDDPDGRCPACWGAAMGALVEYGGQVVANLAEGKSLGKAMTDIDVADVLVSAGEGALTGGASAIKSVLKKAAIIGGAEIIRNTLDVKATGVKVNDAKTVARNTVIGLAVNGAGKAIPSTKVKVKSEITQKQAVKTARAAGPVTTAQRKEIQNQAKKTLKENKAINKTVNGATGGAASGGAAETIKRKEDKANGN